MRSIWLGVLAIVGMLFLGCAESADQSGTFRSTGDMNTARKGHTATLLNTGQVLVAGGGNEGGPVSSAELYDPSTTKWTTITGMNAARLGSTATLLKTGQVLVVGGGDGKSALSSAELYDPATTKWTAASRMKDQRSFHTATLLSDGRALVAGGIVGEKGAISSAELYDPTADKWTAIGGMAAARFYHTATLLKSGQVLVAGGSVDGKGVLSSAELYDPASNKWNATGSMNGPRGLHSAPLLSDGRVLVVGGTRDGTGNLASAELYDPATGRWTAVSSMSGPRGFHAAVLLKDGQALIVGGRNGGDTLSSVELYDPSTDKWTTIGNLEVGRYGHTATLLNDGQALIVGGRDSSDTWSSAELIAYTHAATPAATSTARLESLKEIVVGFLDSFREPDARKLRDRRDVDGLIKALKHDRGHVRDQAAAALGELWSAQVCEALVSALSSDNADTARKAANILEDKGWKPQTDEELARLLMAKDDWVSLAKHGDRVVGTLVSQLTDNKVDVQRRWAISIALGNIDTPTAVQSLTSVKGEVSVFAVSALGRTTQLRDVAVRRVVEALKTSPDGASGAPMSLFLLGSAAVDALAEILWGGLKSKDVFGAALGCLAATGDPRVLSVLDRIATEDRDCKADIDNIRKMYESPPASLLNAARHPKLAVRGCAMMALGNRREHAAIDVLTSALKDSGSPLAPYAALAMGKLGTEAAVGPLTNAVSNGSPVTRKYVAEALGMCGEPSALEPLARLAADADVAVRAQAQLSIERIKSGARIVAGGSHQHQDHEFDTPIDATYTGSGGSPVA